MFFTREDILKIQNALLKLSVKDSELPSAENITYDDTLSIVQNGKNKQIKIEDFFNQISLWKREDFINITDKYDEHYISLIEAINLVPALQRKDGLVITFQDIEGNWELYQFRGNVTEFFEEDKWFNLYDYRNNIIQSIVPDEEDLTASIPNEKGNSLVSLKDRVYDPTSFSGKGYKILRKNIQSVNIAVTKIKVELSPSSDGTLSFSINGKEIQVSVSALTDNTTILVAGKIATKLAETMTEYEVSKFISTITLTRKFGGTVTPSVFSASTTGVVCTVTDSTKIELRNILMPNMINQPNIIYEIRYDYDLHNTTINLPQNCILKFCGGSLNNGKLNGNNSIIEASPVRIFGKDIEISGTFVNSMNYAEWFDLNYEKTLLSFYGIDFIGNYLISKKISVDTGTHKIYLNFHPQSKITVDSKFVGDYLFDIKSSNLSDSAVRSDYNGVSGQGEINLSERCGLISFTASNKVSNLGAKGANFFNLTNVYHAGKSIDTIDPTFDSNTVINTAIVKVESESKFTNVELYASRNSSANKPDCGIFLSGSDHKLNRVTIVISTIGIYGIQGCTYIQDCHIWGAPKIAFYITGNHTINNTYGDWAICSFYFKITSIAANITNHLIIGSTDKNSPWFQGGNMSIIKSANPSNLSGQVSYFYINAYKAKLCANDNDEEVESNILFQYIPKVNEELEKLKLSHVFLNPDYAKNEFYIAIECKKFYTSNLTINLVTSACTFDEFRLGRLPTSNEYYCLAHINKNKYNTLGIFNMESYINKKFDKIIIKVISTYTKICVSTLPNVDIKSYIITKDIYDSYINNSDDFINLPCIPLESKVSRLPEINKSMDIPCFIDDVNAYCTVHYPDKKLNSIIPEISDSTDNDIFNIGFVAQKDREIIMWNGTKWVNLDGYSNNYLRKGTTSNRPSLKSEDEGFEYYDTTLKKKILWNGTSWVNIDGTKLS